MGAIITILVAALAILVGALLLGKFNFGFDDFSEGWSITRRDNPLAYWLGIAFIVAIAGVAGFVIAANYGIDIAMPRFGAREGAP